MIGFQRIFIGGKYDRPTLAKLWGYESFNAISRGVVTPKDQKVMVFFITKEKQESMTQYEDHIDQDILFWEGEKQHGSDGRIIKGDDEVHIFYRKRHHSDFTYEGRAILKSYRIFSDRPSKFVFRLVDKEIDYPDLIAEVQHQYDLNQTEKEAIVRARIGQGLYRKEAIKLWHTCSVTGFSKDEVLIASHIKPWKFSNNSERISPYNSLLLVPTLDKLFDKGYVGFEPSGRILISDRIADDDWKKININHELKLRMVPEETTRYLEYHREYIFDMVDN